MDGEKEEVEPDVASVRDGAIKKFVVAVVGEIFAWEVARLVLNYLRLTGGLIDLAIRVGDFQLS